MALFVNYAKVPLQGKWILFILPLLSVFLSTSSFIISYIIRIKIGDIKASSFIPLFSDIGESSMFTLGMCLSAIFNLALLIIRYHQVKCMFNRPIKSNNFSLYIGCVFVFGKLITACYKLSSDKIIHYIGCGLYFVAAFLYFVTQLYITRKYLQQTHQIISLIRTICTVLMLTSMIAFVTIVTLPYFNKFNQENNYVAQICEWSIVFSKSCFLLTFMYDFWKIGLSIDIHGVPNKNEHGRFSVSTANSSDTRGRCSMTSSNNSTSKNEDYDSVYFDVRISHAL